MAAPNNVELEAAKFLHKLIQESTDEPVKLATKLYVILQHMKSSGKENSMPYQVISRAMETVINQHNIDIEVLRSSRLPPSGAIQMGDSSSSQYPSSVQMAGIMKDSKESLIDNEMGKNDSHASNKPPVGPSGGGHNMYQGSVSHLSSKSYDNESPSSFDTRSTNSQSQEKRDTPTWEKVDKKDGKKAVSKRKRAKSSSTSEPHHKNPQQVDAHNLNPRRPPGKAYGEGDGHGAASKIHGAMPGISSPKHFSSSSHMSKERSMEGFSSQPLAEISSGKDAIASENWKHEFVKSVATSTTEKTADAQFFPQNRGDVAHTNLSTGKVLECEGGTFNALTNANKMVQDSIRHNVTEMSMLRNVVPRDAGKSPLSPAPAVSGMPFKEQHLKQLRAQCLVFLAFRNGLMPKKLHLEIALGSNFPKEGGTVDALRREMAEHKGNEQSINDPSCLHEVAIPLGELNSVRETERIAAGASSIGVPRGPNFSLQNLENPSMMDCSNVLPSTRRDSDQQLPSQEIAESLPFPIKGPQSDSWSSREYPVNNHGDNLGSRPQVVKANQTSSVMSQNKQIKQEILNWTRAGSHDGSEGLLPVSSVPYGSALKDNAGNQSQNLVDTNVEGNRHADDQLPTFPSREHWRSVSGINDECNTGMPVRDANLFPKKVTEVGTDQEEEDTISTNLPPSPKYTTSEKWIIDQQKKKLLFEQNWGLKQRKTEQKIATCFGKLKDIVSSSEDISAKTKSVIELKKLQLLGLQRRLRSDILNDFFKPVSSEIDRLKSIKKHRIGRRSKQLERYEQKMKEERQKRIRERQKEFFSEIEVHKERLDDVFKVKRERWRGFNKYVREFHKRKERIHREKIDRIQREKINLLKINDVEGYLRMVQDAKSDRVKQLLKETEKYLSKLGSKLQQAKGMTKLFETDVDGNQTGTVTEKNEIFAENEDETDQAKHYMESNEKYYLMAHSVKESIAEQPLTLVGGKLREYQMNGLRWLVSLYNNHLNGILADEMGLGKTVQVISLICYLMENKNDRGPFLIVVPSSVLPGWESEINFWAPSVLKIVYSGPPEERRRLFKEYIIQKKFNVLLTTYEYLMNKHDRPKLSKIDWHYVIIDEGHRIKNASCKLNADLKLYRSSHRLLLTGTPLQNNLEELWALLNFLLPNIFNSSEDFSQWFNKPFEGNGDNSPDQALLSEEENLLIINRLHQVLRPFVLRRLKHKVENELPEKIERLVRCEASAYQKLLMKRVEENLGAIGASKARSVHNSVMELRNICNHPYLSQLHAEEVHNFIPRHYLPNIVRLCGKLEMLDRLLPKLKATDHRVLLFSTMTRLLDVMEDYLCWKQYRYLRLDGQTSGGDRGALIDSFNRPGSPFFIFLLSIRAGGVGVNLQAADTVIIFDTDWNPQVDLQAQARAHRIGQKKDVLVIRLETVQTVEEQVRASAEHKLGVANQSITAGFFDNNTSAEDRREYLESLLRECKKEEVAHVLDDDALNDLLARRESEIDIFESIDKERREREMATWRKLTSEGTDVVSEQILPLPSRLISEDDLKLFYEAMKITDGATPVEVSNSGVKRKSGSLGGLDTQHYGRGKRAREVRSYEEQLTEEEFEKLCQVESPDSPKVKEDGSENNLPPIAAASESIAAVNVKLESLAVPTLPPQPSVNVKLEPLAISTLPPQSSVPILPPQSSVPILPPQSSVPILPPQSSVPLLPPQSSVPILPPQSSVPTLPLHQQTCLSKEVAPTPPSKRGRGRPKRAKVEISPPVMVLPEPSGATTMDQKGIVPGAVLPPVSDSLPASSTPVKGSVGTVQQFGTWVAPSSQSIPPPVSSAAPGSAEFNVPPPRSITMQVKGQNRNIQTGSEAATPKRRGKKQAVVLTAVPVPVPSAPPGIGISVPVPSAPPGVGITVPVPSAPPGIGKPVPVPSAPPGIGKPVPVPSAPPGISKPVPVPSAAPGIGKPAVPSALPGISKPVPVPSAPPGISKPVPVPSAPPGIVIPDMGSQRGTVSRSSASAPGPASFPDSVCSPVILKAGGAEQGPVKPVVGPVRLALAGTSSLPRGPVIPSQDSISGISSTVMAERSGTVHHVGVAPSPSSVTISSSSPIPAVAATGSQSILPSQQPVGKQVKGRGRKVAQSGEGETPTPRRRGRKQAVVLSPVADGLATQDHHHLISNEQPQKKPRLSSGGRKAKNEPPQNELQKLSDVVTTALEQTHAVDAKNISHTMKEEVARDESLDSQQVVSSKLLEEKISAVKDEVSVAPKHCEPPESSALGGGGGTVEEVPCAVPCSSSGTKTVEEYFDGGEFSTSAAKSNISIHSAAVDNLILSEHYSGCSTNSSSQNKGERETRSLTDSAAPVINEEEVGCESLLLPPDDDTKTDNNCTSTAEQVCEQHLDRNNKNTLETSVETCEIIQSAKEGDDGKCESQSAKEGGDLKAEEEEEKNSVSGKAEEDCSMPPPKLICDDDAVAGSLVKEEGGSTTESFGVDPNPNSNVGGDMISVNNVKDVDAPMMDDDAPSKASSSVELVNDQNLDGKNLAILSSTPECMNETENLQLLPPETMETVDSVGCDRDGDGEVPHSAAVEDLKSTDHLEQTRSLPQPSDDGGVTTTGCSDKTSISKDEVVDPSGSETLVELVDDQNLENTIAASSALETSADPLEEEKDEKLCVNHDESKPEVVSEHEEAEIAAPGSVNNTENSVQPAADDGGGVTLDIEPSEDGLGTIKTDEPSNTVNFEGGEAERDGDSSSAAAVQD